LHKNFTSVFQKYVIFFPYPALIRGAYRDRHGRRVRDAMDVLVRTRRSALKRTAKSCGPDTPTLVSSFAGDSREATVANKPGHRLSNAHIFVAEIGGD
jgi:hypothetical protein